jgi:hypothetical protein
MTHWRPWVSTPGSYVLRCGSIDVQRRFLVPVSDTAVRIARDRGEADAYLDVAKGLLDPTPVVPSETADSDAALEALAAG